MLGPLPSVRHIYQNHLLDSSVWQRYVPRSDDIVVATSYKSGTTWVQAILANLILGTHAIHDIDALSPWVDLRSTAFDDTMERLEAQQHRRFIKTHLALDGLLFFPQVKYIVVGRDARDVFMSFWNHLTNGTGSPAADTDAPAPSGPPEPPPPDDLMYFGTTGSREERSRGRAKATRIGAICTIPRPGGSTATWTISCLCTSTTYWLI